MLYHKKSDGVIENINKQRRIKCRVFAIKLYFDQIFISQISRPIILSAMAHLDPSFMCCRSDRPFHVMNTKKIKETFYILALRIHLEE